MVGRVGVACGRLAGSVVVGRVGVRLRSAGGVGRGRSGSVGRGCTPQSVLLVIMCFVLFLFVNIERNSLLLNAAGGMKVCLGWAFALRVFGWAIALRDFLGWAVALRLLLQMGLAL